MEKYKILIIEDDPIIQTELQVLLNGNGYEASAVTDFTSVMQAVKNTHPYLILLDIKLPQARKRLLNLFSNPQFFQCTDYLCNKLQYGHG